MSCGANDWKRVCAHADVLRVYATISFLIGAAICLRSYYYDFARLPELKLPLLYTSAIIALISIGAFFNIRIISVIYSISAAMFGGLLIYIGLQIAFDQASPLDEILLISILIILGLMLFIPMYSTWKAWKALR